ncbi:cysteine-rich receptor-like protein kinase 10 [Argentina anserina]|uniref:cysteine-rich receptor-like protein kinase 10 n=1 Tax=Argentina anserina TaxID=57926 RepID=UPI00217622F3|nr:cysteine-rich receptor-like protein kinase 10 [Potentilla anserina]
MNPKISDFGLAKSFADDEETKRTNRICGTVGYMAPEYAKHGIYSMKTDVYSYGVLMLEIISGRKINSFYNNDRAVDLAGYVCRKPLFFLLGQAWALWKEGAALELVDPKIEVSSKDKDQLLRCIHVGLLCTEENDDKRPTMSDVIFMLTNDRVPLPEPTMRAFIIDGNGAETTSINGLSILGQNETAFVYEHPVFVKNRR